MRFTVVKDYRLRTLIPLAGEPTRVFMIKELAREFAISRNHLTKVIRNRADVGVVTT